MGRIAYPASVGMSGAAFRPGPGLPRRLIAPERLKDRGVEARRQYTAQRPLETRGQIACIAGPPWTLIFAANRPIPRSN